MTETEDESSKMFAYCQNINGDCPCPAVAAGFNPSDDISFEVAEYYDSKVEELGYEDEVVETTKFGTEVVKRNPIPEEHAREAWLETIDRLEKEVQEMNNSHGKKFLEIAVEIAEELGWR